MHPLPFYSYANIILIFQPLISFFHTFIDVVVVATPKVSNNNNNGGHGVWQRLSNKIKALELNVSITGRYLEELSVQYKKQIEDLTLAVGQSKDALLTGIDYW